ncbi:inner membrane transport permease [Sulfurimicrobium lacus]|uniref:Inner membrane transport permease n=1 Tax=Sulfurimicrobium lacus TaxID=2715678 RepID=A0A6F8VEP0_9PROT|nr:FtsX-like permease family protein [Sulfurimicrobium lacus]BCB27810.1 inner membrane transport permease [Sulfurimicrobium lacus]
MNLVRLSWRMLLREWRAGELYALALALVVAVGGVTAVSFFTDRVSQALGGEASQLLGADLVLVADHEIAPLFSQEARRRGLKLVRTRTFPSMIISASGNQLAEVKAVEGGYPLRGALRLQTAQGESAASGIPAPGTVWLDKRLREQLRLAPGNRVEVGASQLAVAAELSFEPDSGGGMFSIAPRLMMNLSDLPATQLVQPGSRITYRLMLAGEARAIAAYRTWAASRLGRGEKLEGVSDARPEIRSALERGGKFLGLAALTSVILAAVAIVLSVRRFLERHLDGCAVMRCIGAMQAQVFRLYLYQFLWLGLMASLAGCLLGYGAQWVLAHQLEHLVANGLPAPSLLPVAQGVLTGMATLLGFALPFLQRLQRVPAIWVLRRELGMPQRFNLLSFALGVVTLAGLLLWQAGEVKLGLYVLVGLVAVAALSLLLAYGLIRLLAPWRSGMRSAWRYGLANVVRRRHTSAGQVVALGFGLTALLLLTLVRGDLLHSWQTTLPHDAPNRFIINIQPQQLPALREFFAGRGMASPELFPMVRGRLVAINGRQTTAADYPDDRAKRLMEREFNLSSAERMQGDNQLFAGNWWRAGDPDAAQLSVEEGIAKTLGLKLGDKLSYQVAGQNFTARITSLRKVDWDSFRVNFFVIAPPALLERYPASYITAFYLPPGQEMLLNDMVKAFPNLTVIDVAALMGHVRAMMDRVAAAVEFVFLFTLAAGLMALYAAIAATREERMYEAAVMRTLGASRRQLALSQLTEFALIGLLAGGVAAMAASGLGFFLATRVFHLPYQFNPWLWLVALVAGGVGVTLAGWLGTRGVLRQPPLLTLRQLG